MPHLNWSPQAQRDLSRLYGFLKPHSQTAGKRALLAIRSGVALLENNPTIGQLVPDRPYVRDLRIPFGSSGYLVRYHFENQTVVILRVRHMREGSF